MKILPIGDGVVLGDGASGGFRDPLEKLLIEAKIDFEFVGSRTDNSYEMTYPNHEGWRGAGLAELRDNILPTCVAFAPDLVLLYAGLDDTRSVPDAGIAVARYEKLVKEVFKLIPGTTVYCSQLIPAKDYALEQRVKSFNRGLGTLVETLASKGVNIKRVKMHAKVKVESLNEAGMPTESAYAGMASIWFQSIEEQHRRTVES